jgi:hypothetical protein
MVKLLVELTKSLTQQSFDFTRFFRGVHENS